MFTKSKEPSLLDREITRVLRELHACEIGSEEYTKHLNTLRLLNEIDATYQPKSVSRDTLAVIGGNLLGILMIIKHEHLNVISSRALQMILKPR